MTNLSRMGFSLPGVSDEELARLVPGDPVLVAYRGSHSHGTYVPPADDSGIDDIDIISVFINRNLGAYFGMIYPEKGVDVKIREWDSAAYEIRHMAKLLAGANPNVLSMLWSDSYLFCSEIGRQLLSHREIFTSKRAGYSFTGYMASQIKRMTAFHKSGEAFCCDGEVFHSADCSLAGERGRGSQKKFATGFMGAKRKALVEKYGYDCYLEEETEFLTTRGWRRFDEVGDLDVGTVRLLTGDLEFQTPVSKIDKIHDGNMYVFEPSSSRAVVTPGHQMLVSDTHRKPSNAYSTDYDSSVANWRLETADNIVNGERVAYHVRRAPSVRLVEFDGVSDEYLALAGLYLSEGSANYRSDGKFKSIRFTQKKHGPFFQAADDLMAEFPIRRYAYKKETVWVLHGDTARSIHDDFGHRKGKHLPDWCMSLSARQVEVLWSHMMYGDGTDRSQNQTLYTSVAGLADDIHAMLISAGIPSTAYGPYEFESSYGQCAMYHVMRSKITGPIQSLYVKKLLPIGVVPVARKQGFPVKEIDGVGKRVVCFSVPNGTLITRNNGRVAIHGNCKNAAHAIRLGRMGIEFLSDGILRVDRKLIDADELVVIKSGGWTLERVREEAETLQSRLADALAQSPLPDVPDTDKINRLLTRLLSQYWMSRVIIQAGMRDPI